jgi:hypothetical protein
MKTAFERYDVGAIVTNGETGAASAAMDLAARLSIPTTGFAPRGKINETGDVKPHHAALLLEPDHMFNTISEQQARLEQEQHSPYARKSTIQESNELNAQHSCAVLIFSPGEHVQRNVLEMNRLGLLEDRSRTFVCDLSADPQQKANELRAFLSECKPWFLNVVGPRESLSEVCNYSVYKRATAILTAALSGSSALNELTLSSFEMRSYVVPY